VPGVALRGRGRGDREARRRSFRSALHPRDRGGVLTALIERYRDRLSLEPEDPVVSLDEGSTPLIEAPRLAERIGVRAYLKFEGANPTGSFKDRGMTVAVSRAKGRGAEAVICASTGNTAASAAAYAARAGLRGAVIVPEGKIAIGKLAQALMHGARVIALRGNFDDALRIVRELAQKHPIELVNSINPHRIEGQKTAAFEVVEELGEAPAALAIPVGNAGNVTAYWRGFQELAGERPLDKLEVADSRPILYGFQAEGAAPLVTGKPVENPETVASAIRIGNPARWEEAMAAFTASRGRVAAVSDEQILDAYRWLASVEGVFCEPASAASVAGLLAHGLPVAEGTVPPESVVCVLTGHGLKDPDTALGKAPAVINCDNDLSAVERALFD
jgi:threonine synthase